MYLRTPDNGKNLIEGNANVRNMKLNRLILLCIFFMTMARAYSSQDKSEKPQFYSFIFTNGDTTNLRNPSESALKEISNDISSHRRNLLEVQMVFKNTEKIIFKYEGVKLASIKVIAYNRQLVVPPKSISRIKEIYFETVAVLWDGADKNPFNANFFYIQFHVGPEKSFGKYPYVQLKFRDHNYLKSLIWKQVNEDQLQFTEL